MGTGREKKARRMGSQNLCRMKSLTNFFLLLYWNAEELFDRQQSSCSRIWIQMYAKLSIHPKQSTKHNRWAFTVTCKRGQGRERFSPEHYTRINLESIRNQLFHNSLSLVSIFLCFIEASSEHHASSKHSGHRAGELIEHESQREDGRQEESVGRWWVRCNRRFDWTLWEVAVHDDNSAVSVSSAQHISHLLTYLSSKAQLV